MEQNKNTNPFIEFEWLYTWWMHLGKEKNVEILVVRNHEGVVAFFPFIFEKKWFGYEYNFMGFGQANYMDFITYKHVEDSVIEAVFEYLMKTKKQILFNLHGLLESRKTPEALERYLTKRGIDYRTYRIVTPFVDIESITIDEYMMERKTLHGLDRREKRLRSLGDLTLRTSGVEELDSIFHLHKKRWEKKNDTSGFTNQIGRSFYRKLAESKTGAMRVEIEALYLEERLIAFTYGFRCRERYMGYVLGHDNNFDFFSPGRILVKEKIKKSINSPIKIFDMSIGYEPYKFEWMTDLDYTMRVVFSTNSTRVKLIRNLIWCKERLLSGIKKRRAAVLFRRNTIGKLKFVLRNLKTFATFKKILPVLVEDLKRWGYFFFFRKRVVIMKIDVTSLVHSSKEKNYRQLTVRDAFERITEDKEMKVIATKLYQGFQGYYPQHSLSFQQLFWLNPNVLRLEEPAYIVQLRKRGMYIEKWDIHNLMDICSFVSEKFKTTTIFITVDQEKRTEIKQLTEMGFTVDKEISFSTFVGVKKVKVNKFENSKVV